MEHELNKLRESAFNSLTRLDNEFAKLRKDTLVNSFRHPNHDQTIAIDSAAKSAGRHTKAFMEPMLLQHSDQFDTDEMDSYLVLCKKVKDDIDQFLDQKSSKSFARSEVGAELKSLKDSLHHDIIQIEDQQEDHRKFRWSMY